ncbi:hypothetical protein ACFYVR_24995 [Rhodococcus sp. NPDC003318]|uniref:hypothetical protein n=1 Tax=Rhodococcus sp. NPDC003318 TaxID=3364503 RepID=UPI003674D4EE
MGEPLDPLVGGSAEIARFHRFVVQGPAPTDCHIWRGAVSDDGYGRYWIRRDGKQRVVRPNRYALALALGRPLLDSELALHEVCDNPICVRAGSEPLGRPHVVVGTQSQNLAGMAAKGRGGGRGQMWHWSGLDRAARAARSRALRDAVRDGWDEAAVRSALLASDSPTLF